DENRGLSLLLVSLRLYQACHSEQSEESAPSQPIADSSRLKAVRNDKTDSDAKCAKVYMLPAAGGTLRQHLANPPDLRPHATQLLFDVLVTAVDVIHAVDDALAVGNEGRKHQRSRGAQVGSEHCGRAQRSLAANHRAAAFDLDVRAHAHQFLRVHETI